MASSKRLKDFFEFVRRMKALSSNRIESTSNTSSFLAVVPSVRNTGYGIGNYHYYTTGRKGLPIITAAGSSSSKEPAQIMRDDDGGDKKFPPHLPQSMFRRWAAWILGFFATVVLPFWKTGWDRIQKIEGEAELVVEEIEKVAEVVEKVAAVAKKVSEEVAEALPVNSQLQKTVLIVENISKVAAADAATAENIIQKVEILKQDFQELEKMVRPVINKDLSKQNNLK